jgi:two-component system OmpR family sensor kinase
MRLATRLTLGLSTTSVVTLAACFFLAYAVVERNQLSDLDQTLRNEAHTTALLLEDDAESIAALTWPWRRAQDIPSAGAPYVAVLSPEGKVMTLSFNLVDRISQVNPRPTQLVKHTKEIAFNVMIGADEVRAVMVPVEGRRRVLFFAVSRRDIDRDLEYLRRLFVGLLLAGTVTTVLLGAWLGRRVAVDVEVLARVARTVAQGRLDARVGTVTMGSSELETLAADVDHMIHQLSELVAAQRRFTSYAAHELRSPLAVLRGELQLALRRERSNEEYVEVVASALESVESLARLAEDLLTLARIEGATTGSERAQCSRFIGEAVELVEGLAQARDVTLEVTGDALESQVVGRVSDLARVVRNLVENAVRYSPVGQVVTVEARLNGRHVQLRVSDQGPGIPEAERAKVFEPFYRGAQPRELADQGTGLGLAIARGLVRSVGGELSLDASVATGTCFVADLLCEGSLPGV